ncbi:MULTISPECIES: hypothetical protein [Enterobacteriaceae]|uniref:hypothetical protein n=1 Tax=Bacteria TaxID=2 RepID=UPI001DB0CEDF|nr:MULTISPECIES: hypothetical protein [Enterobacteriaceae]EHS2866882.1 hypothetical protein [Salmonella enterica subsp. enterica serovar Typhimurium]EHS2880499.1 hypothetical protein [Salmonella enterica subsp. enterica serovar Typhimurium]EHS2916118.1 hypothetical protein [Salmonella enterica subsp. enterica serovar Typhimurium]EHS2920829.1 hypothetical protein [Salmonella enterica subsp. enterica serovar Typhimurium]EHS2930103.1 hypothetical protein [Salmonella enterica subsp. enterica serov
MQSLPLNASLNDLADREEPSMRKNFVTCRAIPIYHNVSLRAPLKHAQRDSDAKTAKRGVFPGLNRKNASGTFSARCMTMHETEWRSVWARPLSLRLIFGSFLSVCVTFHARTHPSATTFNSPPLAHTQNTDGHTDVS